MPPLLPLLTLAVTLLLISCDDSPKTCFDRAVLNCNRLNGFAGRGMEMELESPTVKLTGAAPGQTAPMKRKEIVDQKIAFLEESLAKVKGLRQTEDNRDIIQASVALQEHALGVYRGAYRELARLYDEGAAKAEIEKLSAAIARDHGPRHSALAAQLTTAGKAYASRHAIKVIWDIRTSPSP